MIVAFLSSSMPVSVLRSLMQYLEELSIGILKSIRGRRVDLPPDRAQCEWRSETSFEHLSRRFCGLKGLESRARGLPNRSEGENIRNERPNTSTSLRRRYDGCANVRRSPLFGSLPMSIVSILPTSMNTKIPAGTAESLP